MSALGTAALWMIGSVVSFSAMAVAGREVSTVHDTFEVMLYRSVVGIVIMVGVLGATRNWQAVATRRLPLHALRNLSHFTGQNLWFFAVGVIPLAQVFALEFTVPLWVLVLSPFVLAEAITRVRAFAALLGFTGILVLTQPFSAALSPGLIAAALAAIGFAGSAVLTRRLTRTESLATILFYLTTLQTIFGLIGAGFDGEIAPPALASGPWLVLIGCAGLFAHFCLTKALALAPATLVMPIDFARLPLIAAVGWALYDEALSWPVVFGAAIILVANWINLRAGMRESG